MDLKQTKNYGTEVFLRNSVFKATRSKMWSTELDSNECYVWSCCSGSGSTMWKASKLLCWSNHQLISWLMIWN